jgi:tetratricopeptide (TPR) repeat protein
MRACLITSFVLFAALNAHADPPPGVSPQAWQIAELAMATQRQAQKENDLAKYRRAHALYQEYLAKNADDAEATLTFCDAAILFKLERYDEAAKMYDRVLTLAPTGKRLAEVGHAFVLSTKNAAEVPDGGVGCSEPNACAIPAGTQRVLAAFDRYLRVVKTGDEVVHIEYNRARVYYDYHQYATAAPLFDEVVATQPEHELAGYSALLELDCWFMAKRLDEMRSAIARFKKSPIWNDGKLRAGIEEIETALQKKP